MNLFKTKMTAIDADKVTTCENKRVGYWTGLKLPREMVEARVAATKGRTVSAETRAKLSAANKGRVLVKDSSLISKALKGVPKSKEHCKKISEAHMGKNVPAHLASYNAQRTKNALRYKGLTVKEWAEVFNVSRDAIRDQLKRNGHLDYVGRKSGWAKQKEAK
jgi:hypothetical protein